MANYGNHDQHVKAGQQSHKSTSSQKDDDKNMNMSSSRNNQNQNDSSSNRSQSSGTQGGTHEQHVKAGQQSHKNSK